MDQNVPVSFINKEFNEHNCYIAELIVDNNLRVPNRTFFPAEWSPEKVISKIQEAYSNFQEGETKIPHNYKGRYIVRGFTKEGMEIEMILNIDAEMKTAYPIID